MKSKKVLAGFLTATILSASAITGFAAYSGDLKSNNELEVSKEVMPISGEIDVIKQSYFNSFTGTVKEIRDFEAIKGSKFVSVENDKGEPANIIVSEDTYILDQKEITVGAVITGFFKADAPMIMIYPAQYSAEVVVVKDKAENVKVDLFDKDLVSRDYSLKLNISDKTNIISQDGKAFEGELANRKLVVTYGASTRSIPAQTNPTQIVVLSEKAAIGDVSTMDIIVNNQKIEAPAAYTNAEGIVMVPLRTIAEALGFDVSWNGELQSIMLGKGISLKIGEDYYIYMKTAPIQLGTAPELVEGRTFVPLSFFKEVTRMNNAYVFEAQIVIDNEEKME